MIVELSARRDAVRAKKDGEPATGLAALPSWEKQPADVISLCSRVAIPSTKFPSPIVREALFLAG